MNNSNSLPENTPSRELKQLPVLNSNQKLDIKSLRDPNENTFLAVIIVFNCLVFTFLGWIAFNDPPVLFFFGIIGVGLFIINHISFQFFYWYLYGNSILVTPSQYPEVYRAVQKACDFIDLYPTPSIFILHGAGLLELFLVKRFTKRGILVFTSELIETLLDSGDSRQLMMLIGRQLGHIKAGHYRLWFFKDVIGAFTIWFHAAWWRRCHYTADRIGFLIAGDLQAARQALISITVGKKLSVATNIEAIREQDNELRENFFAILQQLFSKYPYIIHRIIELQSFREFVAQQHLDSHAEKIIGALPQNVNKFQIIVKGNAIFGDQGIMTVSQLANV